MYNGANYVGDAIASHLDQTFEDFELIVSDNVPDDDTVEIVEELAAKDSRVRLSANESNVGANRNYNITFAAASRGDDFLVARARRPDRTDLSRAVRRSARS